MSLEEEKETSERYVIRDFVSGDEVGFYQVLKSAGYEVTLEHCTHEITSGRRRTADGSLFVEVNGKLVSTVGVFLIPMSFGDGVYVKNGAVAGVATNPDYRKRGFAKHLMIKSYDYMQRMGAWTSSLFTAKETIAHQMYLKHGYFDVTAAIDFKSQLPLRSKAEGTTPVDMKIAKVRNLRVEEKNELFNLYQKPASQYIGLTERSPNWYEEHLMRRKPGECVVLTRGKEIIGYLLGSLKPEKKEAWIDEIIVDPDVNLELTTKQLILAACENYASMSMNSVKASIFFRDIPFLSVFQELGFEYTQTNRVFMFKVVNANNLLLQLGRTLANRLKALHEWEGVLELEFPGGSLYLRKHGDMTCRPLWTNIQPDVKVKLSEKQVGKFVVGQDITDVIIDKPMARKILHTIFPSRPFLIYDRW